MIYKLNGALNTLNESKFDTLSWEDGDMEIFRFDLPHKYIEMTKSQYDILTESFLSNKEYINLDEHL